MFPLGTVLFPSLYLPLHVFEPRYQALVRDCLEGDHQFGVVLIERGSEVGGGELRTGVGTAAQIIEAAEMDGGRWALGTVGVRRIRVEEWLDDAPYPRAMVQDWPDELAATDEQLSEVVGQLRRVLAMAAELGDRVAAATLELADDIELASFQMAAMAPLGPADQQRLLATGSTVARLEATAALLGEVEDDLRRRVELDAPDPG
jgi:uncharacterized protein